MTQPRSKIISLEATPYYHCIARCVRRAFLCGEDHYTGKNFDHRKPWLINRLKLLGEVFAIDIAAYAIMSNHYHVVLHVDKERCQSWSLDTVIRHWLKLYKGPEIIHRYLNDDIRTDVELQLVHNQVDIWRERLASISWFMACLNEYLARRANKEDECKGRFWESRFKSQALLDETALVSCMAYVDLNPVRAGISKDLESSNFTSAKVRIQEIKDGKISTGPRLMPFSEGIKQKQEYAALPFCLKEYIALVDWTGRSVRNDKRGYIQSHELSLLSTLGLSDKQWKLLSLKIQKQSIIMLHGLEKLAAMEGQKGKKGRA